MGGFRVAVRLPLFLLVTVVLGAFAILGNLLLKKRAPDTAYRMRGNLTRLWARINCRVLGMQVEVEGEIPSEPYLLVTNHLGYVDILLLCSICPVFYISRADVRNWPLLGPIIRNGANILFIDRSQKRDLIRVGELMEQQIDQGYSVIFFPEATSTNGSGIVPFKPSLLQGAAEKEEPVYYGCLYYETPAGAPPAGDVVCWWGDASFFPHLTALLRIRRFKARVRFGEKPIKNLDRKLLAKQLREAIVDLFEPI